MFFFQFSHLGVREAAINVAEGKKRSTILASEAIKQEQINRALGEAEAIIAKAKARANAIEAVAISLDRQVDLCFSKSVIQKCLFTEWFKCRIISCR